MEEESVLILVTPIALEKFREIIRNREKNTVGIRIRIKSFGCAGLGYDLEFVDRTFEEDEKVQLSEDIVLFVHKRSISFLKGTEIDYKETPMKSGFVFKNPNEKTRCGCGASFQV